MLARFWGLVAALALISGCGTGDDEGTSLDGVCDIRESRCQRAIFEATAKLRGHGGASMPPVGTLSLMEFSEGLHSEASESTENIWDDLLPILKLLPAEQTLSDASIELQLSGVAAFYDTRTKSVSVIDRGVSSDPSQGVLTLAHEFAHALQDQHLDLRSFFTAWATSFDSSNSLTSLVEGEATVLGLAVVDQALRESGRALDWSRTFQSRRASFFERLASSRTPLLAARQSAPYMLGLGQLAPLWRQRGQAAIDDLYAAPPLSVLDWMEDTQVTSPTRLEALDCLPTMGPEGFSGRDADSFGPLGLVAALLGAGETVESAWSFARAFRADKVVAFEEDSTPDSGAVAWRLRFATEEDARLFVSITTSALAPGSASERRGREVLYYGTTLADRLSRWTDPGHCGTESELPRSAPSETESAAQTRF